MIQLFSEIGLSGEQLNFMREKSKTFRFGERLLLLSSSIQFLTPLITFLFVFAMSAINTLAQSTSGPIFTPDSGQAGKAIVNVIRIIYVLLFVAGFIGVAWACFNVLTGKEWMRPGIGAICCWGAGIIAMAVYKLSKGESVDVNVSDLGGN